ncbi:MAG: hypothetical protein RL148_13 [Planctomycetota bacterium]
MDETPYLREKGYATRYRDQRFHVGYGPRTDARERAAVVRLLARAANPRGPWLDVPSGAGRLSGLLPHPVVQVDRDAAMLVAAGQAHARVCASASALPFAAGTFSGVLCMRLLQHVPGAEERIRILSELARVTTGPVVVSFFDAFSLQSARRMLRRLTGKKRSGRCAVSRSQFAGELRAAGLEPVAWHATLRFLGEQTLVLCRRRTD